jgi:hypothetical protein
MLRLACRTYSLLFDWMYPGHFRAVLCCLEAFADTPAVTTPLLKFVSEFVFNKSQRLTFDSSSPNGILLFREVSTGLVAETVAGSAAPVCQICSSQPCQLSMFMSLVQLC